jgi:hypothetical protein
MVTQIQALRFRWFHGLLAQAYRAPRMTAMWQPTSYGDRPQLAYSVEKLDSTFYRKISASSFSTE